MSTSDSKSARDNRSSQLNPCHSAYYLARGQDDERAKALAIAKTEELSSRREKAPLNHSDSRVSLRQLINSAK